MSDIRCPYCDSYQNVDTTDIDINNSEETKIVEICKECEKPIIVELSLMIVFDEYKPNKLIAKVDYTQADGFSCKKGDVFYTASMRGGINRIKGLATDNSLIYENVYEVVDPDNCYLSEVPADPNIWEFQEAGND